MKSLIFGIGDVAEVLYYHLSAENIEVAAFVLTTESKEIMFCGTPVVHLREAVRIYPPNQYGIYVTVGFKGMNTGRKIVFDEISSQGYSILSYIHPTAQVAGECGLGTIALQNVVVECGTKMGIGNILYTNAVLSHHDKVGDFNFFAPSACVAGRVFIGNYCFIGANATIRDHVRIADYTLVGANCYIHYDTNPQEVILSPRGVALQNHKSDDYFGAISATPPRTYTRYTRYTRYTIAIRSLQFHFIYIPFLYIMNVVDLFKEGMWYYE